MTKKSNKNVFPQKTAVAFGGMELTLLRLAVAGLIFAAVSFFDMRDTVKTLLFLAALTIAGADIFINAVMSTVRGNTVNEYLLVSAAGTAAFLSGVRTEAVSLFLLFQMGRLMQEAAMSNAGTAEVKLRKMLSIDGTDADANRGIVFAELALKSMEEFGGDKTQAEKLAGKITTLYPYAVLIVSALVYVFPVVLGSDKKLWLYRALTVMGTASVCGAHISVPLAYYRAIGSAWLNGIGIRNASSLERLATADKATVEAETICGIKRISPADMEEQSLLRLAASVLRDYDVPQTRAVCIAAGDGRLFATDLTRAFPDIGAAAIIGGKAVLCGSAYFMEETGTQIPDDDRNNINCIYISVQGRYAGCIELISVSAEGATGADLGRLGVKEDNADCKRPVQGVNVSFDIKRGFTQDTDVVLLNEDGPSLDRAAEAAKLSVRIGRQNFVIFFVLKAVMLAAAVSGVLPLWLAAAADAAADLVIIYNAMRANMKKGDGNASA